MRLCSVEDCDRRHYGHGYCELHLERWKRTGDPLIVGPRGRHANPAASPPSDPVDRLDKYIVPGDPADCWEWTGRMRTKDGYPLLCDYRSGKAVNVYVHRLICERHYGPIPAGYQVDHLCRNTGCVNPAHLEAVTLRENWERAARGRDEHGRFMPL